MKPQSAKAKGRNLQKKVKDKIMETFSELEEGDARSTSMGAGGEDIQLSPRARKVFPFQVECKSLARSTVYKYMDQAGTHGNHTPLVVLKSDYKKPLVIIDMESFFDILKRAT